MRGQRWGQGEDDGEHESGNNEAELFLARKGDA